MPRKRKTDDPTYTLHKLAHIQLRANVETLHNTLPVIRRLSHRLPKQDLQLFAASLNAELDLILNLIKNYPVPIPPDPPTSPSKPTIPPKFPPHSS